MITSTAVLATALCLSGGTFPPNGECTIPETEIYIPPDMRYKKNRQQRRKEKSLKRKLNSKKQWK